ncbi:MAG: ABC transporter [Pseudomonadota bacterium]
MNKIVVTLVAIFAIASITGCSTIGKGKGKEPPAVVTNG